MASTTMYFTVKHIHDSSFSWRELSGENASAVIKKALDLYMSVWNCAPDQIIISCKEIYTNRR
jgi:hypothetical protein